MPYEPPFPSRSELLALAMVAHSRERGVHDMSVRSLAAAVRAAPGSLTYHHRDKDTIFATCARFLGDWLARDLTARLTVGGEAALFPDTACEAFDELEYARRLRVWIQLSTYALHSPVVAPPVRAGEERMANTVASLTDGVGASAAQRWTRWAAYKSLVTLVLLPEGALTTREAVEAWECASRR